VRAARELLHGTISAVGLAAGDRIVVGAWHRSPIGAFADVMWAEPDGTRLLLARDERTADYVAGIYLFDRIEVVRLEWTATPSTLSLHAGQLQVDLAASGGRRVSVPRPWWFTRWVEGPIARRLIGVDVHGTSPLGSRSGTRREPGAGSTTATYASLAKTRDLSGRHGPRCEWASANHRHDRASPTSPSASAGPP
jgi:hypothetical protein